MHQDNVKRNFAGPNELLDRLKEAYSIRFDAQLARVLEVNASTVATWRKNNSMKFDKIIEFSNDLNLNWLFYGEGPVWRHQINSSATEPELPYYTNLRTTDVSVPKQRPDDRVVHVSIPKTFIREKRASRPEEFFLTRATGNSMEPTIRDRELLLVQKSDQKPHSGRIYLIQLEESILCKRIHELPGNRLRLMSDNNQYQELDLEEGKDSFAILGRVVWHGRTL